MSPKSPTIFQPLLMNPFPRFSDIATFMRLPNVRDDDPRLEQVETGKAKGRL